MTHKFSLNLLSFRSYRSIETVVVSLISYDISVNNRAPSVCKHCRSCDLWFNHLNQLQCCQELVYSIYSLEIWSAGISVSQRTWTQSVYVCLQGCCWAICTPKMSDGRLNHVKQIHRQQKKSLKSIFVLIFSCCTNYLFSNSSFKKQHIKKDFHSFTERCQPRCCFLGWELTGDISRAFMFVRNLNFAVLFLFTVSRFSFMKRQELVGLCGENLSPRQY